MKSTLGPKGMVSNSSFFNMLPFVCLCTMCVRVFVYVHVCACALIPLCVCVCVCCVLLYIFVPAACIEHQQLKLASSCVHSSILLSTEKWMTVNSSITKLNA